MSLHLRELGLRVTFVESALGIGWDITQIASVALRYRITDLSECHSIAQEFGFVLRATLHGRREACDCSGVSLSLPLEERFAARVGSAFYLEKERNPREGEGVEPERF